MTEPTASRMMAEDDLANLQEDLMLAQCLPAMEHRVMLAKDAIAGALKKAEELEDSIDRTCIEKMTKAKTMLEEALDAIQTQKEQSAEAISDAIGFLESIIERPTDRRVRQRQSDSCPSAQSH